MSYEDDERPDLYEREEQELLAKVALGRELEADIRDHGFFSVLKDRCRARATEALQEIVGADPTDTKLILTLQNDINMFRALLTVASDVLREADYSETRLNDENDRTISALDDPENLDA